ncbi:putative organic cation transporter protein [Apostichopus japonicus]|uniref:Putative organic cation transporter protein n=1 Tax=Stichopus japonicus TaxID=307972 RepID=A0A2G8LPT8_STIJA|nr:putative organic cation transporter protein [Apostichopus japonicus]
MEVDEALEFTKPLGCTQVLVTVVSCLAQIQIAILALSTVFIAEVIPHHCIVSELDYPVQPNNSSPASIVYDRYLDSSEETFRVSDAACYVYENGTQLCTEWEFDTDFIGKTIVTEWDLVCARDILPDLSQSIMVIGFAVGSLLAGPLADKCGRRPTLLLGSIVYLIIGLLVSFSPNYVVYVCLRSLLGAVMFVVKIPSLTLQTEYIVPRYRSAVASLPLCASAISLMMLSLLAYFVRDWRYFSAAITLPGLLIVCISWFLPESVRWLIAQGQVEEAERVIQKIAKFNKVKQFPSPVFDVVNQPTKSAQIDSSSLQYARLSSVTKDTDGQTPAPAGRAKLFRELFGRPTWKVTLILSWNWATYSITYFGFALSTGTLAGTIYLNFFLISLVDLPARTISIFIVARCNGLKVPSIDNDDTINPWIMTSLALLGKFLISLSPTAMNLLISEQFPTNVRNSGRGFVEIIGNIGILVVPLLLYMGKYIPNVAFMTMSFCAVVGAGLCLFLPETLHTTQPDTAADLQLLFDTKRIIRFGKRRRRRKSESEGCQELYETVEMSA